jgi:RES domain-containing protein
VPISGVVFPVTSPRYRDLHSTALITQQPFALGRFNTAECGAVYVAREPETACEELRRRLQRAGETLEHVHPRSIFVLDIHLHAVADIRTRENLIAWGLTANDVAADDMKRCQNMARTAAQLGYEAVRWLPNRTTRSINRLVPPKHRHEIGYSFCASLGALRVVNAEQNRIAVLAGERREELRGAWLRIQRGL